MVPSKLPYLGGQPATGVQPGDLSQAVLSRGITLAGSTVRREGGSLSRSSSRSDISMQSAKVRRRRPSTPLKLQDKACSQPSSRSSSPQPSSLSRACSMPVSRRHRAAILASASLHTQCSSNSIVKPKRRPEPRDVALIRMIVAEAKRRHVNRPTFQKRLAEQEPKDIEGYEATTTLWKLRQSVAIFREAMHDILGAVKACSLTKKLVEELKERDPRISEACSLAETPVEKRKAWDLHTSEAAERMQRQLPKLSAVNAFHKQLQDCRTAESEWRGLASTLCHMDMTL